MLTYSFEEGTPILLALFIPVIEGAFRYAIVVIFIIAAMLTPTPDVINQSLLAVPMLRPDGTAIGSGLATSLSRLRRSQAKSRVIVLVTDGANNAGEIDPVTATDIARAMGVRVYTIGVGRGGQVPMPMQVQDPFSGRVSRQTVMTEVQIDYGLLGRIAATESVQLAEILLAGGDRDGALAEIDQARRPRRGPGEGVAGCDDPRVAARGLQPQAVLLLDQGDVVAGGRTADADVAFEATGGPGRLPDGADELAPTITGTVEHGPDVAGVVAVPSVEGRRPHRPPGLGGVVQQESLGEERVPAPALVEAAAGEVSDRLARHGGDGDASRVDSGQGVSLSRGTVCRIQRSGRGDRARRSEVGDRKTRE